VWHSDDEAKEDVLPDVEKGMYTEGMDPEKGPIKIPQHEVARQRAAAQSLKASLSRSRSCTSSEADDPNGPDMVWSHSRQTFRKNEAKDLSDSEMGNSTVSSRQQSPVIMIPSPEPTRQPTPMTTPVNSDDEGMSEDQRRKATTAKKLASRSVPRSGSAPDLKPPKKATAAAPRALLAPVPSPKPEAKASPMKGQESPGTKVRTPAPDPHPMATRRHQASRAGSLRPGGGSWQTDTRVDLFHPSKT
jgi:hypothetical protein